MEQAKAHLDWTINDKQKLTEADESLPMHFKVRATKHDVTILRKANFLQRINYIFCNACSVGPTDNAKKNTMLVQ